ncbi:MAG: hypothetical protein LC122_09565 [Chitinophagales bacterium]|nr:hypothetical protein [Chitinophagales bacterium]
MACLLFLIGVESRSTVDMDTTMKNKAVTIDSIKSTLWILLILIPR